ncbi:inactive hydroxysteroid dehydrogenase-like protein 1 [Pseudophryne corroboree]|uniref:inactive hydroxysteroid dehydrogenase-like protein 1 n=1 Tax=Pseudophryne corroboree TaxID=495146 RepID=UPI0030812043
MEVVTAVKGVLLPFSHDVLHTYYSHREILAILGAWYTVRKAFSILRGGCSFIRQYIYPCILSRTDHLTQYGEWAVVTGATDGIGKAYAEELASHGVNIILVSRNIEKLQKVSEAITRSYGVKTRFIVADFSWGREVYPAIKEGLRDVDVGILVNNAGVAYEYPQLFNEVPEDKLWEIINVNIAAAVMMVHIVLPGMVKRKRGAIINVSSASCYKPLPLLTTYAASKSFLDYFSQTLHYEYSSNGIFIQSVIPFFVVSNMTNFSSLLQSKSLLVPSAKDYAHQAVRTIGVCRRTAGHWSHSIQVGKKISLKHHTIGMKEDEGALQDKDANTETCLMDVIAGRKMYVILR